LLPPTSQATGVDLTFDTQFEEIITLAATQMENSSQSDLGDHLWDDAALDDIFGPSEMSGSEKYAQFRKEVKGFLEKKTAIFDAALLGMDEDSEGKLAELLAIVGSLCKNQFQALRNSDVSKRDVPPSELDSPDIFLCDPFENLRSSSYPFAPELGSSSDASTASAAVCREEGAPTHPLFAVLAKMDSRLSCLSCVAQIIDTRALAVCQSALVPQPAPTANQQALSIEGCWVRDPNSDQAHNRYYEQLRCPWIVRRVGMCVEGRMVITLLSANKIRVHLQPMFEFQTDKAMLLHACMWSSKAAEMTMSRTMPSLELTFGRETFCAWEYNEWCVTSNPNTTNSHNKHSQTTNQTQNSNLSTLNQPPHHLNSTTLTTTLSTCVLIESFAHASTDLYLNRNSYFYAPRNSYFYEPLLRI
jgi:hypothetical protein